MPRQCRLILNETLPDQVKMAASGQMVNRFRRLEPPRICQDRTSVSSGDQVGSEAKAGVGTGCSTRPVMSTM